MTESLPSSIVFAVDRLKRLMAPTKTPPLPSTRDCRWPSHLPHEDVPLLRCSLGRIQPHDIKLARAAQVENYSLDVGFPDERQLEERRQGNFVRNFGLAAQER